MKKRIGLTHICIVLLFFLSSEGKAQDVPKHSIQAKASEINWKGAGLSLPKGSRIAILEGDPKSDGIFTMRVELPARAILRPHTHPKEERVTVLSGKIFLGFGEEMDLSKTIEFNSGDYYVNPANVPHFLQVGDEITIVQLTGIGPWELHNVK